MRNPNNRRYRENTENERTQEIIQENFPRLKIFDSRLTRPRKCPPVRGHQVSGIKRFPKSF